MNKVTQILQVIVDKFKSGEIPDAVAYASYPIPDIPSCEWSFTNRTLMFLGGTGDARGFRQWKEANRWVKKGAKAIHIMIPCFKKKVDEESGDENNVLRYFKSMPVFRVEDTEGEKLDYESLELPDLPLLERAEEWGISVKAVPGDCRFYGYYSPKRKEIGLATSEEAVFFHELAHAGHENVKGGMKSGQDPFQEIVAELSAQALCRLVGKKMIDTTGNSYRYIESYAEKVNMKPYSACLKLMAETEKVLNLILKTDDVSIVTPLQQ
ncbi:MAG: antirestriction protein [Candidatus Latescibacteria bacterium]|jgi:hypothetical protein|nr:antirestriction protein [Candidatus Latescibacterota bacterium]